VLLRCFYFSRSGPNPWITGNRLRADYRISRFFSDIGDRAMRLSTADINIAKRQLLTMHYRSRVGHLGGNLSALDAMMVLHHELMGARDRFILSKGHSAGAYYVTLWSLGLISELELTTFHKDDTRLSGHSTDPVLDRQSRARSVSRRGLSAGCAAEGRAAAHFLSDLRR